jgi:hypothetical protein
MLIPSDPESELLFRLVQRAGNTDAAEERILDIVKSDLDWDTAINLSSRHGLLPLLHELLSDLDIQPPDGIEQSLHEQYTRRALENIDRVEQLDTIVQALRDQGIRVIPYKGPMVAQVAYDELGQRWFTDLDLLVAPEDVLDAREILKKIGYRQTNLVGVNPERLVGGSIFRWGGEFHFKKDDCIPVELRYRFVGKNTNSRRVFHDLWDNRTSRTVAGVDFPALSPEDRLVVLLAHGTKHGWNRLSWIYDLALLSQQNVDWETVLKRSKRYGWERAILLGLALTGELADVELPSSVRRAIASDLRAQTGSSIIQKLYQDPQKYSGVQANAPMSVLYLNNSMLNSSKELCDIAFSPWEKDYQWVSLPPRLYPLYYLVRPCRLGVSTLKRMLDWL